MAPGLVKVALRRTVRDVKFVRAVPFGRARGLVRDVYGQVERDFGMLAPPMALHSASEDVLAAAWVMLRESLVAAGATTRAEREVVATAVSEANACPYCIDVHGITLETLGEPEKADELAKWAKGEGEPPDGRDELVAVAVAFHYLNRMVSVFLPASPLPPQAPRKARAVLGFFMKPGEPPRAGDALDLLPASAQDGPDWATPGSTLADAFARAAKAMETAGERTVPPRVRALVQRELKAWDGKPPGLSRAWVDEVAAELPEAERAKGRLALLVAKVAYQVTEQDIVKTSDRELIELTAWVSHAAARELGTRLPGEDGRHGRK